MARSNVNAAILTALLALGGCSFASDALFPSLSGGDPAASDKPAPAPTRQAQAQPSAPIPVAVAPAPQSSAPPPPMLGSSNFEPPSVTQGSSTGTFVGQKVAQMRGELQQLQGNLSQMNSRLQQVRAQTVQDSQGYHGTVAAMNARLQVGTTPGNPLLMQQWNQAQSSLDRINEDIARMNQLANESASASTVSAYLLDSVRATRGISGAVDEDHRQLTILEDETSRTVVLIERLLTELSADISRQQAYYGNERGNLNMLAMSVKNGQFYGASLSNRSAIPQIAATENASLTAPSPSSSRPLMVIRFDKQNVPYEQALYTAVSRALERKPNATFDLVAISPAGAPPISSSQSRRDAEQVLRSLTNMGLPAARVRLSASTSGEAQTPEVHVFVH
jgi:hypothetical protein